MSFPAAFDLKNLNGKNGFSIAGIRSRDELTYITDRNGDINADSIDDIVINAPFVTSGIKAKVGAVYVILALMLSVVLHLISQL